MKRGPKPVDPLVRFYAKVQPNSETGCWEWRGSINNRGYGRFYFDRKWGYAHRFAYRAFVGPIGAEVPLDHLCRVTRCVNPYHLEPVTTGENNARSDLGYARRTLCRNGLHDIADPENILTHRGGARQCKPCARATRKRTYERTGK